MVKELLKKYFIHLGGEALLRKTNKTPRVLFWHGVDLSPDPQVEAESFNKEDFIKQINYLRKNYEVISLDEFQKRFQNNTFSNKEIVLTFDDGYVNNLNVVFPILNEFNIPFAVFVSTDHIETGELFPTSIARLILLGAGLRKIDIPLLGINNMDISNSKSRTEIYLNVLHALKTKPVNEVKSIVAELKLNLSENDYNTLILKFQSVKPMDWDEVIKLHQLGATIGSHCKYHICCHENQEIKVVKEQIIESKQIIEQKLQSECKYFAYPNGDYTVASNSFVKDAGYAMGFSTEKNRKIEVLNDTSIIPRIGVPLNINTFKIFVNLQPRKWNV